MQRSVENKPDEIYIQYGLLQTCIVPHSCGSSGCLSPGVLQASAGLKFTFCREQMPHNEIYLFCADFGGKNNLACELEVSAA